MRTLFLLAAMVVVTTLGWAAGALSDELALVVALLAPVVVLYVDPQCTLTPPENLDHY